MSHPDEKHLHQIVDELLLAIRLEQHLKVAQLSGEISRLLVRLLDDEIEQLDDGEEEDSCLQELLDILTVVCQRLNRLSTTVETYHQVVEFVQIYDLVCLGQLVGATKPDKASRRLDFDNQARIIRQAKLLLREVNQIKNHNNRRTLTGADGDQTIWFNRKDLIKSNGIGFSRYSIDLNDFKKNLTSQKQEDETRVELIERLARLKPTGHRNDGLSRLIDLMNLEWFVELLRLLFERVYYYPFDRFTILVSIYIVSVESNHRTMQNLVGLLIDQIYHQETNSCSLDELMQLTQVGSFWLSHRKRFLATFKQHQDQDEELSKEDDEDEDEVEDDDGRNGESEEDTDNEPTNRGPTSIAGRQRQQAASVDLHQELRKLIDLELLIGSNCLLCNREPSGELLEPIHLVRCPSCSLELSSPHCSISYRSIGWLSLDCISSYLPHLNQLVALTPNEWLRQMLAIVGEQQKQSGERRKSMRADEEQRTTTVERIDISDTFERLTMVRGRSQDGDAHLADSSSDSSGSDESDEGAEPLQANERDHLEDYVHLMRVYLADRLRDAGNARESTSADQGDSLAMIRLAASGRGQHQVAVNASELVISDSLNDLIKLKLFVKCPSGWPLSPPNHQVEVSRHTGRPTTTTTTGDSSGGCSRTGRLCNNQLILACQSRSPVSQLMTGCGRLYGRSDFVRSTGMRATSADLACPSCAGRLLELAPFCEGV